MQQFILFFVVLNIGTIAIENCIPIDTIRSISVKLSFSLYGINEAKINEQIEKKVKMKFKLIFIPSFVFDLFRFDLIIVLKINTMSEETQLNNL